MPIYQVMCFNGSVWDQNDSTKVEAEDEQAAAEQVCGGPLSATGAMGRMRAEVSTPTRLVTSRGVQLGAKKTNFYLPE